MTVGKYRPWSGFDLAESARRIERHIETLAGSQYTASETAICRYAYLPEYRRTVDYFASEFRAIGFDVWTDPVGTLVASNRPPGAPVFGLGSHCDSNRNGGKYDGTLGVVTALEIARHAHEQDDDLPLRVLSFIEEEASGFGQMCLGSKIMLQLVSERELREVIRDDNGVSFWDAAKAAGYRPEGWRESRLTLDGMTSWIEIHIEQGRVLQDHAERLGIVDAIAGYVHADMNFRGRADHAGATPMSERADAAVVAAAAVVELERLASAAGGGAVATCGQIDVLPGLANVVPEAVRLSLDLRSPSTAHEQVYASITNYAEKVGAQRGVSTDVVERARTSAVPLDRGVVEALVASAEHVGASHRVMHSGAAHDTMYVAAAVPSAMLFIPCVDGLSHTPLEQASTADAALAAQVVYTALSNAQPPA